MENIKFKLNGKSVNINADGSRLLLWVLRTDFGLTGTKYGCGESLCGACTVLVNNEAVHSCQTTISEVKNKEVITIEGLSSHEKLHAVQKAFIDHDAMQCGYCTPGMILTAYSLLRKNPKPSYDEIIEGMNNNLCRCGAHKRIVEAVKSAADVMKGGF